MFSFIPAGMARSIVEYLISAIPGAILLFAFFLAAEIATIFLNAELSFIPVICAVPILAGVISTLVLEKVRNKPLNFKRGALVGAAAGLFGVLASALMIVLLILLKPQIPPFGSLLNGWIVYVALLLTIFMDTVLGALGGAVVVKFIK